MKRWEQRGAFTLIEVVAMVMVIVVLAGIVLPRTTHCGPKAGSQRCVNNLKNVGLAVRIFAEDNGERYPAEVLLTNGAERVDALRVFLTLSNELSTPRILYCPADAKREEVGSFTNLTTKNISYFVSLSAGVTTPSAFLAGDWNLQTNEVTVGPGLLALTQGMALSWSKEIHGDRGTIVLGDGSVEQFSSSRLKQGLMDQRFGSATNWLAIP